MLQMGILDIQKYATDNDGGKRSVNSNWYFTRYAFYKPLLIKLEEMFSMNLEL